MSKQKSASSALPPYSLSNDGELLFFFHSSYLCSPFSLFLFLYWTSTVRNLNANSSAFFERLFLLHDIWRASTYVRALSSSSSALTCLFVSFFRSVFRFGSFVRSRLFFSLLPKIPEENDKDDSSGEEKLNFESKKNESTNSERS